MSKREVESFFQDYNGDVFILFANDEMVGFSAISKPLWNRVSIIEEMAVDEKYQSKSYGKYLISYLIDFAQKRGDRFVTVQTTTWNIRGLAFYLREGFTKTGEFKQYYGDDTDMVWLERKL